MNPIKRLPAPPASPSAQGKPGRRFGFYIGFSSGFYLALSILLLVTGTGWGQGWKWLTGGNLNKVKFIGQKGWIIGDDGNQGIILHTTDGGDNWAIQPHNTGKKYFRGLSFSDSLNGWVVGGDESVGMAGFVLRTRDGGRTWSINPPPTARTLNSVCTVASDTNHLWITSYADTIFRTTNGGSSWDGSRVDGGYFGIDFVDTLKGFAVTGGTIFHQEKTTDGGRSWSLKLDNTVLSTSSIDMIDSLKGWSAGSPNIVALTSDGWQTVIQRTTGGGSFIRDLSFHDTLNGFMVGGDNNHVAQIFTTTNGGLSWTWDSLVNDNAFNGVDAGQLPIAWVTGTGGSILKTTTSGNNWTVKRNVDIGNASLLNGTFYDTNQGWAVGTYGVISHTKNGGTVWRRQPSGVSSFLYGVSFADSQSGKICTDGGGVLGTRNGGNTWAGESTGATSPLWSIAYPDTSFAVAVGGYYGPLNSGIRGQGLGVREKENGEILRYAQNDGLRGHAQGQNDTLPLKETSLDYCKRRGRLGGTNPTTA